MRIVHFLRLLFCTHKKSTMRCTNNPFLLLEFTYPFRNEIPKVRKIKVIKIRKKGRQRKVKVLIFFFLWKQEKAYTLSSLYSSLFNPLILSLSLIRVPSKYVFDPTKVHKSCWHKTWNFYYFKNKKKYYWIRSLNAIFMQRFSNKIDLIRILFTGSSIEKSK